MRGVSNMPNKFKNPDIMDLLKFNLNPEPEQFNMTAPENLMTPVEPEPTVIKNPQTPKAPVVEPVASVPAESPSATVKEYIKQKYGLLDPESYDSEMKKAQDESKDRKSGLGIAQFLAGAGDAIAGRSPSETAKSFQGIRDNIDKETVGNLESRRKAQLDNLSGNNMLEKMQRDKDQTDPNSSQSMSFRKIIESKFPEVARAYGSDWSKVSAADQELIFKPLQLKEQMEARKETARILGGHRDDVRKEKAAEKLDKKKQQMFEIEDRRQNIDTALGELDKMIDEDGTYEMFGSHNQDLDRKVEQVATDMAKLMDPASIARPSEVEQIKKTLVQSGFQNRNGTARDLLKNFKGEVQRRADSAYQIRGLEKPASSTPSTGPKPGTIENGYRFKGGDPSKQENWEAI